MRGLAGYLLLSVALVFVTYAGALIVSGRTAWIQIIVAIVAIVLAAFVYRSKAR
jgi:hypothetical protein